MIQFAPPTTNQQRSNEFPKESIYIPVQPRYNIIKVDENGVVRTRTKGHDTQEFPPEKAKIIGKISIK